MSSETNMMKCEEYQETLAADPAFDGGAGHLTTCRECQAFRRQMLALDDRLAAALALDVPTLVMPELPDIDSDTVAVLPVRRRISPPGWFAIAASLLLALFIGVQVSRVDVSAGALLEEQLLAHIDHEPYALTVSTTAVSASRLARIVPPTVATLDHDAGLITYAQSCVINGHEVPHLVIQGERGPITILLMPEEMVDGARQINGESVQGYILQVGDGSIAIVGEKEENLDRVKKSVLESVAWGST